MFGRMRGSTQTILLIVLAAIVVVGGSMFLWHHFSVNAADMRAYHCSACDKDFQADVNTLGNSAPMCPACGKNDNVTMAQK